MTARGLRNLCSYRSVGQMTYDKWQCQKGWDVTATDCPGNASPMLSKPLSPACSPVWCLQGGSEAVWCHCRTAPCSFWKVSSRERFLVAESRQTSHFFSKIIVLGDPSRNTKDKMAGNNHKIVEYPKFGGIQQGSLMSSSWPLIFNEGLQEQLRKDVHKSPPFVVWLHFNRF